MNEIKDLIESLPAIEQKKAFNYYLVKDYELLHELIQDVIFKVTNSVNKYGKNSKYSYINIKNLYSLSDKVFEVYNEMLEHKDYLESTEQIELERDYFND